MDTAAGPKRVLKFSAAAVRIRDLKMAVPVGPQIQHIDGAPGSTSTLRGGGITMYVESLTGTLAGVQGLPTPPVLRVHLTPDTVPEWLYDTIGNLGLKLRLGLDDADIDQAGTDRRTARHPGDPRVRHTTVKPAARPRGAVRCPGRSRSARPTEFSRSARSS